MKSKAWELEFARKCQPLKPICIGCCWASNGTEANRSALLQYQAVLFTSLPVTISFDQQKTSPDVKTTPKPDKPTCKHRELSVGCRSAHVFVHVQVCMDLHSAHKR